MNTISIDQNDLLVSQKSVPASGIENVGVKRIDNKVDQNEGIGWLRNSSQTVRLSETARKLNELYNTLGKVGSDGKNALAQEELRQTIKDFAQSPDNTRMVNFLQSTNRYENTYGPDELQNAFLASTEAAHLGMERSQWWDTFSMMEQPALQRGFVEEALSISTAQNPNQERAQVLDTFAQTIQDVKNRFSQKEGEAALTDMFYRLQNTPSLEEKSATLVAFREKNLSDIGVV